MQNRIKNVSEHEQGALERMFGNIFATICSKKFTKSCTDSDPDDNFVHKWTDVGGGRDELPTTNLSKPKPSINLLCLMSEGMNNQDITAK